MPLSSLVHMHTKQVAMIQKHNHYSRSLNHKYSWYALDLLQGELAFIYRRVDLVVEQTTGSVIHQPMLQV